MLVSYYTSLHGRGTEDGVLELEGQVRRRFCALELQTVGIVHAGVAAGKFRFRVQVWFVKMEL